MRIATIEANLTIADVVALRANAELIFDVENSLRQILGVFPRRAQQVERNTLGRFLADAGEAFTLLDEPGKRLGEFGHLRSGLEHTRRQAQPAEHAAHLGL